MRRANSVAVVTGDGTGIGATIAQLLVQEGAQIIITDRRREV